MNTSPVQHWQVIDVPCCGHCPFFDREKAWCKNPGRRAAPVTLATSQAVDAPGTGPPDWCPLRAEPVILRVQGDGRLPEVKDVAP